MGETRRVPAHRLVAEAIKAGMPRLEAANILWPNQKRNPVGLGCNRDLMRDMIPSPGTWGEFLKYLDGAEIIEPDAVPMYIPKHPLAPVEDGHGWLGVLLRDTHSGLIQCHICGGYYKSLGPHIFHMHRVRGRDYKLEYGLKMGSALVTESTRTKMVIAARNDCERMERVKRWSRGTKGTKRTYLERTNGMRSMEYKNAHGICPQQLLERLRVLADRTGRTPTHQEMEHVGLAYLLPDRFGSITNALRLCGLVPRRPSHLVDSRRWKYKNDPGLLLEEILNFEKVHGREPTSSDIRRGFISATVRKYFGSLGNAIRAAQTLEVPMS